MFADSLLESAGDHRRTNRGWTTIASLALQVMVLSALAIGPILYPEALSLARRTPDIPIFSSAPKPVPIISAMHAGSSALTPSAIPLRIGSIHYGPARPRSEGNEISPPNVGPLVGSGPNLDLASNFRAPLVNLPERTTPLRLSHMDPGSLVRDVKPVYPEIAVRTRTQGTVVLHALISKDGSIESLQVVSGHPFLARAALEAVRQWRYRPYLLNGQPIEVETQITVNFTLGN